MHRSRVGFVAIASVLAWSGGVPGCSTPSSDSPSGSGGKGVVATGGATVPGSGGAVASTSGGAAGPTGTGGSASGGAAGPTGTGGSVGQTGGIAAASGGVGASSQSTGGNPGAAGGGNNASGGRSTSTGGAGGTAGTVSGTDPGTDLDGDFVIMPPYAGSVAVTNVPHSTKFQFTMTSMIYPGGSRPITVYIPKQYVDGAAAPFIIITDGNAPATGSPEIVTAAENHYLDTDVATRIPPIVFVFIPPGSNRSGEYDTVSDAYTRFINTEALPLVNSNADIKAMYPGFKLTTNPDGRAAYGCSSGSPAAMGLGWFGDFHRIVSYSGTFVALQMTPDHPLGAWEYPAMILATMPPKPLRIFLEVGEMDNGYMAADTGHKNWVTGNRNMAAALKTMGYHYRFLFAMGAGHCEGGVKSKTYSQTLNWVWRGYSAN